MPVEMGQARPAYVTFELRTVEDRPRSEAEGRYIGRDVAFAIITPAGSKDRIEKQADEWLAQMNQQVRENRFPEEWLQRYKSQYSAWKESGEIPLDGTPIKTWPAISPAQAGNLLSLNIRTVEDLAVANEETLARIGMGSRNLKQKAVEWIDIAKGPGAAAIRLASLELENNALKVQVGELHSQLQALRSYVEASSPNKPASAAGDAGGANGISADDLGLSGDSLPPPTPLKTSQPRTL